MPKKILCLLSVLLVIASIVLGTALTASGTKTELDALEDRLAEATKKREDAERSVDKATASYADALEKKQAIDTKIYALDLEIVALNDLIKGYEKQIESKNAAIDAQTALLDKQYEIVRQRLRIMHEDSNTGLFEILLDSDGLTNMFLELDRYMSMLTYDKKLIASYTAGLDELQQLTAELTNAKAGLDTQKKALDLRKNELEADLKAASKLVASAENKLSSAERDLEKVMAIEAEYEAKRKELLEKLKETTNQSYVGGKFMWPLPQNYTKVSSGYGWRIHPVTGKQQFHIGIDIPAAYGTEIYAVNDGTVVECSYNYADGNYITIDHGGGIASFYSHLSRRNVAVGDKVKKGQVIANVGTSGYTTGPHLNLNIYENGNSVNPLNYFK